MTLLLLLICLLIHTINNYAYFVQFKSIPSNIKHKHSHYFNHNNKLSKLKLYGHEKSSSDSLSSSSFNSTKSKNKIFNLLKLNDLVKQNWLDTNKNEIFINIKNIILLLIFYLFHVSILSIYSISLKVPCVNDINISLDTILSTCIIGYIINYNNKMKEMNKITIFERNKMLVPWRRLPTSTNDNSNTSVNNNDNNNHNNSESTEINNKYKYDQTKSISSNSNISSSSINIIDIDSDDAVGMGGATILMVLAFFVLSGEICGFIRFLVGSSMSHYNIPMSKEMHVNLVFLISHILWVVPSLLLMNRLPNFFVFNKKMNNCNDNDNNDINDNNNNEYIYKASSKGGSDWYTLPWCCGYSHSNAPGGWLLWICGTYALSVSVYRIADLLTNLFLSSKIYQYYLKALPTTITTTSATAITTSLLSTPTSTASASTFMVPVVSQSSMSVITFIVAAIAPCVTAPLWEEIFYRGLLLRWLVAALPVTPLSSTSPFTTTTTTTTTTTASAAAATLACVSIESPLLSLWNTSKKHTKRLIDYIASVTSLITNRYTLDIAILINSFIFAVHHSRPDVFLPLFALGLLWSKVYLLTGSLFVSTVVHSLWNGRAFVIQCLGSGQVPL